MARKDKGKPRKSIQQALEKWSIPEPNTGCTIWFGSGDFGYGRINYNNRLYQAHRLAFESVHGPVPKGMVLDHLCRVRCCINPDHLQVVSNRENVIRGKLPKQRSDRNKKYHASAKANKLALKRICTMFLVEKFCAKYAHLLGA